MNAFIFILSSHLSAKSLKVNPAYTIFQLCDFVYLLPGKKKFNFNFINTYKRDMQKERSIGQMLTEWKAWLICNYLFL